MNLKCLPCTDRAIEQGDDQAVIPDAFTMSPYAQAMTVAGQSVIGCSSIPICRECRAGQLGRPSANGRLLVA